MKKDDIECISEDTDEILEDTQSINRNVWILIGLWIMDKIVILGMFLWLR